MTLHNLCAYDRLNFKVWPWLPDPFKLEKVRENNLFFPKLLFWGQATAGN